MLRDPRIRRIIDNVEEQAIAKLGITQERVLQELALIGFARIKNIVRQDEDGNTTVNLNNLSDDDAAALTEIHVQTGKSGRSKVKNTRVKIADKRAALVDLGKHLGMFKEKIEVSGSLSLEQLVRQSMTEQEPEVLLLEDDSEEDLDL